MINATRNAEVELAGALALKKALGPVGMVQFLQKVGKCEGDYTEERQKQRDPSMDEAWASITAIEKELLNK